MPAAADPEALRRALLEVLDETFETHHGVFLDGGTSLLPTLEAIDAAAASRVPMPGVGSIAAKVAHAVVYLEAIERYLDTGTAPKVDWAEAWRTTSTVSAVEWLAMRASLAAAWRRLRDRLADGEMNEAAIEGGLGVLAHGAYHLGEIREAAAATLVAEGR